MGSSEVRKFDNHILDPSPVFLIFKNYILIEV